jgi:hypothetical protein
VGTAWQKSTDGFNDPVALDAVGANDLLLGTLRGLNPNALQVGEEAAPGLVVGVAHIVARRRALAANFTLGHDTLPFPIRRKFPVKNTGLSAESMDKRPGPVYSK